MGPASGRVARRVSAVSDTEWRRTHLTETYKSLITISVEALKMLALVNGGAAVALLTYLGNLVSHGPTGGRLPNLTFPLLCYSIGLLLTILAFLASYATRLALYNEEVARFYGQPSRRGHHLAIWAGIGLAVLSAVSFGVGSVMAGLTLMRDA